MLQDLILKNFWLKFFSVALATVIWLSIHYGIQNESPMREGGMTHLLAQEYIRVPVTVSTPPGDTRAFRVIPSEVVVVAMGDEATLRGAANRDFKVSVDLTDFHAKGPTPMVLQSEAPADLTIEEISPSTVSVEQVAR
ncbi:MAG TPA: CdaR family protein [Verrucomicrobiae bacterium]|jgi:YbbR domain-containing protein